MTMSPRARPSKSYSNELAGPSTARSFSFAPYLNPTWSHGKHRLHRELSKTPTYGSPSITTTLPRGCTTASTYLPQFSSASRPPHAFPSSANSRSMM
jgi:hypothetical protein